MVEGVIAPDRAAALAALRAEMKAAGDLDAYIVPSEDPHMSEYPPDCCARRQYISGFTGSAGTVVVTKDAALLWTDGRYYLQGEQQLAQGWTLMRGGSPGVPDVGEWLADVLPVGAKVGVDPFVHTVASARKLKTALAAKEQKLVPVNPDNLVDKCDLHPRAPQCCCIMPYVWGCGHSPCLAEVLPRGVFDTAMA
jgi:Xaa-Pro aminopeptidase